MKVYHILFIVALFVFSIVSEEQKCENVVVRKNILDISSDEWENIKRVVNLMYQDGWFDKFAKIHVDAFKNVHGCPVFLPFHRLITRKFEMVGQTYDKNFFIPYWDSAKDFAKPESSKVLNEQYLGGNGNKENGSCVENGFQASWKLSYPSEHCLKRVFNGENNSMKPWFPPETITSFIQTSKNFDDFRQNIELTIHGVVHLGFGGEMTSFHSPNDFVFMVHHSNIDRIWTKWQNANTTNSVMYDGTNKNSEKAMLSDIMEYFNVSVQSVFTLGQGDMCYSYDDIIPINKLNTVEKSLNTRPIFYKSRLSENSTEYRNLNILSKSLRNKYFPALEYESLNPNSFDMPAPTFPKQMNSFDKRNSYKEMPIPEFPPLPWINMHGYKVNEVERVVGRARSLISELNSNNYRSPYY
ncbi:hypothetical protein BB559_006026 [Furculomyces boomerangus]|uniref:Tyrosinase copper-binding domain-containing protein n=2 Tax=Harpellales TaxID=61421 RepID=A0A2T9Y5C0_9FUNG|nr:hypothetical protein BB559_006666 [Furculomyces boomerangus]PVU87518.1 hypothetical protein BB559_006026 [Furculomyces boomerangus]PWA00379.1 hypothetical protein BB558_003566 [Smittium angustum]